MYRQRKAEKRGPGSMRFLNKRFAILMLGFVLICAAVPQAGLCYGEDGGEPFFSLSLGEKPESGGIAAVLKIFLLLSLLSLAPAILIMVTSFTRIVIVLSVLRQAMGTHQMPPNQIILGIALFLTFFVMGPIWNQVNQDALQPFMKGEIGQEEALKKSVIPLRQFMFKQTREKDLALLFDIADLKRPKDTSEVPTRVLIPSFVLSELKTAFQIGFLLYIPFLIIDMVVASILLSMGMMMLPPVMISLPFKLMLFVLADGWRLIVGSVIRSFG